MGVLGAGCLDAAGGGPSAEVVGALREAPQPLPGDALLLLGLPYVLVQPLLLHRPMASDRVMTPASWLGMDKDGNGGTGYVAATWLP